MKISRLKRRADDAEADARNKWLEFRTHSDRSLAIVRQRVGSPAGLAISFSLGFVAGTVGREGKTNGTHTADSGRGAEENRGAAYNLAHGRLGDAAIRLGTVLVARLLMHFLKDGRDNDAVNGDERLQG